MRNDGCIARWQTPNGRWWAELYIALPRPGTDGPAGYYYRGDGCGGNLGTITEAEAIAEVERKVAQGYFAPDANKRPLARVPLAR